MTSAIESATLTVEEAAKLLGIGRQTAYDLARQMKLPGARRLGRRIVVSRKALEAFLNDDYDDVDPLVVRSGSGSFQEQPIGVDEVDDESQTD